MSGKSPKLKSTIGPDKENPEWTAEDFRNARPALAVITEVFGADMAVALQRGRGRPAKAHRKISQTLRLDPDVLDAYKRQGAGWQTRINALLRAHMPTDAKEGGA